MDSGFLALRDDRFDHIPGLKAFNELESRHVTLWKSKLIRATHLPRTMSFGFDF
jgi:hypothetical protein